MTLLLNTLIVIFLSATKDDEMTTITCTKCKEEMEVSPVVMLGIHAFLRKQP